MKWASMRLSRAAMTARRWSASGACSTAPNINVARRRRASRSPAAPSVATAVILSPTPTGAVDDRTRAHRAEPEGPDAWGQYLHRPDQLVVRAPGWRQVRAAHGRYRSGALGGGIRGRHRGGSALARLGLARIRAAVGAIRP